MVSLKPPTSALEQGVGLPKGYEEARDLNLVNLRPWHLLSDSEFTLLSPGISERYPARRVIPFARREDNDDVAAIVGCDAEQDAGQIIVIHDYASPGFEVVARMKTFWDWLRYAVDEMIAWHEGPR